jgi:hypothetical protein
MAQAEVEIIYKANATSLEASVGKITQVNDELVKGAAATSKKVADEFKKVGGAAAAAFGSQQVKAALDQLNKESDKLTANLKELQKEQVLLVASGNRVSKAYQDNAKAQLILKNQISQVNAEQQQLNDTFDKTENKQKSLTGQLRALKQELALLEQSGQDNTDQFRKLTIEAAKLEDQIGDTRERVRVLSSDTFKFDAAVGAVGALSSGFEIAQGAAALFGEENKNLQEAINKTTAVTAIANGVNQLANQITGQGPLKLALLAAGQKAVAVATAISTGAISAFKVALAATGIGLFLGAIALLVTKLQDARDSQASFNRSLELAKLAADGSRKAIQELKNIQLDASTRIKLASGQVTQAEVDKQEAIKTSTKLVQDNIKTEVGAQTKLVLERQRLSKELADAEAANAAAIQGTRDNIRIQDTKGFKEQLAINESQLKASQSRVTALNIQQNTTIAGINQAFASEEQAKKDAEAKKAADERSEQAKKDAEAIAKAEREAFANLRKETAELQLQLDKDVAEERKKNLEKLVVETADLEDTSIQTQLETRIAFLKKLEVEEGTSLDRRINILELEAKKRQADIKDTVSDKAKANNLIELDEAETQAAIRAERQKSNKQAVDEALEVAKLTADVFAGILDLQQQVSENRIADIETTRDKEIEAINQTSDLESNKKRQREAAEFRAQQRIAAERTKQAKAEKALALFQAIISTATAIAKASPNPLLIAFAAATGAAQIAAIAATPIPKFKKGGEVGGRSHEAGGTLIEAEKGEFIVNKSSVARHRDALDAMNRSSVAFKKYIDDRYVRPALMDFANKNKGASVTVNASLNSKSMEKEIKGLRKDLKGRSTIVNINASDSRYQWQ